MSVILITGALTGIGNLTANALAADGHVVYASMRAPGGKNAHRAQALLDVAARDGVDLRVVELDVQSQNSADAAVRTVLHEVGQLDVVVQNAGHLSLGYTEAFTAEDVAHLLDVNAVSVQRINRAVLPHMRERRTGTLLYVGSTTTVNVPPFIGPYVASKFAFDALAQVTAYEVSQFGIETVIVMPGPFTQGTDHFQNAGRASDQGVVDAYVALDPMGERTLEATNGLFGPGVEAKPIAVAEEITRILTLPVGKRPFRSVVDFTDAGADEVNALTRASTKRVLDRMGYGELLELKR